MEERTPPARSKSARSMEPSPQWSGRSGLMPSRAATAGVFRDAAGPPSCGPSGSAPKWRGESPRGGASARSRAPSEAPSEAQDSPDANGYVRGRRPRAPPPTPEAGNGVQPKPFFECSMEQPAFKAILDWWESAASVLGVTAGMVTQGDVEERLERASGTSKGRGSLAEPFAREAREAREARDAARRGISRGSPPDAAASGQQGRSRRLSNERVERDKDGPAEERDGGGIPGLDFIYRILAPRELMERYERLEQEVESHVFKSYSQEEQEAVRKMLSETQAAIEQRENRLNILAAAVGGLHGAYVGTMAAMLAIFVPQRCPPTELAPSFHTCNLYENTHDLSLLNQAVLAFNGMTLIMMLLTELSVFRREKWLDTTLSYNPRKAARFLSMPSPEDGRSMLEKHPYIAHQLLWQNLTAGNLARATIALVLVNLILSSVLIVGFYSDGARSIITIITNTMLLGAKLLWAAVICLQSKNNQQGVSLYKTMRINFNIIDANFLEGEEYARNKTKYTWEQVQEEYKRVALSEKGDLKMMATQAKHVIRHIAVGRQTTTALKNLNVIDERAELETETEAPGSARTPKTPASAPNGDSVRAGSVSRPDPSKASPAEEYA